MRTASCAPSKQLIAGDVPSPRKQRCRDGYRALIPLNTLS